MSYTVFAVTDKGAVDELYEDDLVSRQSITVRDGSALELDDDVRYILLEGSDEAQDKAGELLGDAAETLDDEEAEEVFEAIKDRDQAGAQGMGAIFGD